MLKEKTISVMINLLELHYILLKVIGSKILQIME